MKRILFPLFLILLSLFLGNHILSIWRGISLYQGTSSRERLIKAIGLNPSNPDPFYKLSLLYQWDLQNIDLREALKYLKEAIQRNPLEQQYYLHLAKLLNRSGEEKASEHALEKAILLFPTGFEGRWVTANLLLQQGKIEKAIPHFSYILKNYPNQSGLVYEVLFKGIKDRDQILEKVVPRDRLSMHQYLTYLYEIGEKESAKKAWEKKYSYGIQSDRQSTLRHIEFLIAHGEIHAAYQVWKERLKEEGLSFPGDGNLITNGGFEKREILGGGFDWKIHKVSGAEVSFDPSTAFEGKNSLRIVFDGKENVDFHHVYQVVPVKPGREYRLRAYLKTKGITTKSGIKIEVSGIGFGFQISSEPLIGDNEWREMVLSFRTPAHSQGALVRVRREKTDKFDRYISGTVWIDDVSLKETR